MRRKGQKEHRHYQVPRTSRKILTLLFCLWNDVDCILPCHRYTFGILLRNSLNSSLTFVMIVQSVIWHVYNRDNSFWKWEQWLKKIVDMSSPKVKFFHYTPINMTSFLWTPNWIFKYISEGNLDIKRKTFILSLVLFLSYLKLPLISVGIWIKKKVRHHDEDIHLLIDHLYYFVIFMEKARDANLWCWLNEFICRHLQK